MIAGDRSTARGAVAFVFATVVFVLGCASQGPLLSSTVAESPLSNQDVARLVLNEALGRVTLSDISGQTVAVVCAGDSINMDMVLETISFLLTDASSRAGNDRDSLPRLTVSVETLEVSIDVRTSLFGKKTVERRATASLTVDIETERRPRRSYDVSSTYSDRPDASYTTITAEHQPSYVEINRATSQFLTFGKPIGLAVFMTGIVWTLYSYRG